MSDNDYIAEYIKEKYPTLLGFDFAMWKLGRCFAEALKDMSKGIETRSMQFLVIRQKVRMMQSDCK